MSDAEVQALPESDAEDGPLRRCIATGERLTKDRMVRFVVGPEGSVVPDLSGSLPGRGLWLRAGRGAIELAVKRHSFDRAARRPVRLPDDLPGLVERLLVKRCIETISLARKAGRAVAGYEKVRGALGGSPDGTVLAAVDGAADGRRKIGGLAGGRAVVAALTAAELGAAFGRPRAVHAFVAPGPLASRVEADGRRLAGIRGHGEDRA